MALGAAALLSFLATLAFGGPLLVLHLVIDVLLVTYLALVLKFTRRERARSEVAYLSPAPRLSSVPVGARRTVAR